MTFPDQRRWLTKRATHKKLATHKTTKIPLPQKTQKFISNQFIKLQEFQSQNYKAHGSSLSKFETSFSISDKLSIKRRDKMSAKSFSNLDKLTFGFAASVSKRQYFSQKKLQGGITTGRLESK